MQGHLAATLEGRSAQCVLNGGLQLRQYDRISRVDTNVLTLKPTGARTLRPGECILMTERKDNVHWFGTDSEPALIFNLNIRGTPEATFDSRGTRNKGRYYVDPTSSERQEGLIVAREIGHSEAIERFSKRSPFEFPLS